jgi:alanyl-tRNA synthetase
MALHTAQHCLSRALLDLHEAVTISSRLGASAPTIDVDLGGIDLRRAVEAQRVVNAIVDQDREVRQFFPVQSELDAMALRKAPRAVDEAVRVVDVRDFDITPCGGTHVTHTSQIELVYVRSVERYKGGTRITFDAGPRARRALLRHRRAILDASSVMKSAPDELLDAVSRLSTRLDESRREAGALRGALADRWAAQLDGDDVVIASLAFADAELLSAVATRLATGRRVVALAASEGDGITVLVACGPDTDWHAGHLMRALCEATGGRGGGRDRNARGRVPPGADWEEALGIALGRAP